MKNLQNNYHDALLQKINFLKAELQVQEVEIKFQFNDIVDSIKPIAILKQSIATLTNDNEIKIGVAKLAINLGTNYVIDTFINKNYDYKQQLFSMFTNRFPNSFLSKIIRKYQ